jgi:signal transduction histidine kinase
MSMVKIDDRTYPKDILELYQDNLVTAVVISNLIGPILYFYWSYGKVEESYLFTWISVQTAILIVRYTAGIRLTRGDQRYIYYTIVATWFSGLLWGVAAIMFAQVVSLFDYAYFILFLLFLASGAITTISVIYHGFFGFTLLLFSMLIYATAYVIDIDDPFIAIVVLILFGIYTLINGYKYYQKMKLVVEAKDKATRFNQTLKKEVEKQTRALSELNENLEKRVDEEIEKNRQKDQCMQEQARLAQMGEMISMIAHQWRQPLNAVGLIIQDLEDSYSYGELTQEELEESVAKGMGLIAHMSQTIDDFRNFYKPDRVKMEVQAEDIVTSALKLYEPIANKLHIAITTEFTKTPAVDIYKNELIQVVLNILKNASDNFEEKEHDNPTLTISTYSSPEAVVMAICDNGGGIDATIINQIFDPYFSTKMQKNGTGLGLYMSKNIVEGHHGGRLSVENCENGVCFKIELERE